MGFGKIVAGKFKIKFAVQRGINVQYFVPYNRPVVIAGQIENNRVQAGSKVAGSDRGC